MSSRSSLCSKRFFDKLETIAPNLPIYFSIFCLLFNKNFAVIPLKIEGANTRITTLLNSIGLENRICRTISELDKIYKTPIDYNKVNTKVNSLRENGIITAKRLLSTI